jgi:asparagine synthase (glutamine-hydrolysing)
MGVSRFPWMRTSRSCPSGCSSSWLQVKPKADRAFLAHCLGSLSSHLGWILFRHDRIGMVASIEMRVPFLENQVFDFALHLPRRAKLHRKIGKWVVKQAAAETLPADIVHVAKKGFPVPEAFWAGTQKMLIRGALADTMQWSSHSTDEVLALLAKDRYLAFHLVGMELFLRMAFGGETPESLGEKLIAVAEDATPQLRQPRSQRRWRARPHMSRRFA